MGVLLCEEFDRCGEKTVRASDLIRREDCIAKGVVEGD
jgi:hypothetical protein